MFLKEKFSSCISNSFFYSKSAMKSASKLISSNPKIASLLGLMQYLPNIVADNIYPKDTTNGINYRIYFNSADFSNLKSTLSSYCQVLFYDSPPTNYTLTDSPQCYSVNDIPGPSIGVAVEFGKKMTSDFQACLDKAMQSACDTYYDNQGSTETLIVYGVAGLAVLVLCMGASCVALCRRKSSQPSETTPLVDNSPAPNNEAVQAENLLQGILSLATAAAATAPNHHDHHHSHHKKEEHRSHVVWHKSPGV